jgi:hypothetical protein
MKFVTARPFADPDAAARKLVEIANAAEAVQDGRIHIELINMPFLNAGGPPAEYRAGIERAGRQGMAVAARVRRLCEVHPGRRQPVRLMGASAFERRSAGGTTIVNGALLFFSTTVYRGFGQWRIKLADRKTKSCRADCVPFFETQSLCVQIWQAHLGQSS